MQHKELLIAAARTVDQRGNEYGDMRETHARIARLFNDMVPDVKLEPHHVAAVLMAVKLARLYAVPNHDDSYVDLAAYCAFRSELVAGDTGGQLPLDMVIPRRGARNRSIDENIQAALEQL